MSSSLKSKVALSQAAMKGLAGKNHTKASSYFVDIISSNNLCATRNCYSEMGNRRLGNWPRVKLPQVTNPGFPKDHLYPGPGGTRLYLCEGVNIRQVSHLIGDFFFFILNIFQCPRWTQCGRRLPNICQGSIKCFPRYICPRVRKGQSQNTTALTLTYGNAPWPRTFQNDSN